MNKNAVKNFAIWARGELLRQVRQRAFDCGVTESGGRSLQNADLVNGRPLRTEERAQRDRLLGRIAASGFDAVMEQAAYTWFNRFIALRFLEVNGYLPSYVRVFSDESDAFRPDILREALTVELDGLDRARVVELLDKQQTDELFRYLLITQCNALNGPLPGMFERIEGCMGLLLPDHLLRPDSVPAHLVADIPEEDWKDQVQIIGWLYQYYNTEVKEDTYAQLKKNIKVSRERVPAATQLFTPDWIVRYMVENSLGRLYADTRYAAGNSAARSQYEKELADAMGWRYFIPEAEQTPETAERMLSNTAGAAPAQSLQEIRLLDPCMGSGHILVYAFDVLMQLYQREGWAERDAARSIVENNLYGLDIDPRAGQLAYFALMMKARQYDRRWFSRGVQPHLHTPGNDADCMEYGALLAVNAKEFGPMPQLSDELSFYAADEEQALEAWCFRSVLAGQYDVVVTNPPYMGAGNMNAKLAEFVKKHFPDSKSDLFACFIERCGALTRQGGYSSLVTMHAWMFLSSFEKLREKLRKQDIMNMAHLGPRAFEEIGGEVVQTVSFVLRNSHTPGYLGTYCRLLEPTTQQGKEDMFLSGEKRYIATQDNFSKIPGSPIAYWVSEALLFVFENGKRLGEIADSKQGLATADNNRFLRLWYEVPRFHISLSCENSSQSKDSGTKWFPYNKGGEYRKWYGNNDFIVNWENDGAEIRNFTDEKGYLRSRPQNTQFYFRKSFSWSLISSSVAAFRYKPVGHIFDVAGMSCFSDENLLFLLALCNTKIVMEVLQIIAPTINYQCGDIANIPVLLQDSEVKGNIESQTQENIMISRTDWDAYEISWDFKKHPMV